MELEPHRHIENIENGVERNLTQKHLDELTYDILGCAIEVHKQLGPGLLESVYHQF